MPHSFINFSRKVGLGLFGLVLLLSSCASVSFTTFDDIDYEAGAVAELTFRCLPTQENLTDEQLLQASSLCKSLEAGFDDSNLATKISTHKPDTELAYLIIEDIRQTRIGLQLTMKLQTMGLDVAVYDLGTLGFTVMDRANVTPLQHFTQNPQSILRSLAQLFERQVIAPAPAKI